MAVLDEQVMDLIDPDAGLRLIAEANGVLAKALRSPSGWRAPKTPPARRLPWACLERWTDWSGSRPHLGCRVEGVSPPSDPDMEASA